MNRQSLFVPLCLALLCLVVLPACPRGNSKVDEINKLISASKYDDAASRADLLLQEIPNDPAAMRVAILAYARSGRSGDARTTYARLAAKSGHDEKLIYILAEITLGEAAQDPDEERRATLLQLLARAKGEYAVTPLATLAKEGEDASRAAAARVLGEIPGAATKDVLLGFLGDKSIPALVQVNAAASLLRKGEQEGQKPLAAALSHKNDLVAATAARGFAAVGDPRGLKTASRTLSSNKEAAALIAAEALGALEGKASAKALQEGFSDARPSVRVAVARAAGKNGASELIPSLRKLLQDPDPRARAAACAALATLVDSASIDALRAMTTDDINDQVKLAAAQALQRLKDELGFEFVFRVVGDSSKPELRAAAFAELSALGDTNFLKNIVSATEDKEPPLVRAAAISALGELASKEGAPKIVAAAKDKEPSVRLAAARALALINAPGALSALSDLLGDAEASVRVQASVSLLSRRESPPEAEE